MFRSWAKGKKYEHSSLEGTNKKVRLKGTKIGKSLMGEEEDIEDSECCSHKSTFITITTISAITNFKFRVLLFTGLFRFTGLSFPM
jgi:hypothetical protein